ncbi:MAG TPA: sulfite exporter TauE/SafE family protein [Calidithermus sp.]|nr:sulfite exporter TauE/SafE family protein [Calidithermus sp.]
MSLLADVTRLALGFLIGAFGTLIGAGGGFLLVPLLLLGYHFAPPAAVGTSLSLVFLNAASGSVAYLRQRRVDLSLGWKFAAATVPGAVGGAYLARAMSSATFSLAFGAVLVALSVLLVLGKTAAPSRRARLRELVDAGGAAHAYRVDVWKGVVVSFAVGLMSSVLGIGGGIIHVPFLIVALGLPVHVATATSHFVLSISAFVGALTFLALGHVDLRTVALMGSGILVGAQVGARASLRAGAATIRLILGLSLALVGVRMIWHGLGPLR